MAGEVINLATFQLDTQKLQNNLNDLQDTYFDLRKEQKAYADQSKETAKQIDLLQKSQKALSESSADNTDAIEANEKELQALLKTQKDLYKSEQNLGIQMGTVRKEINQTTTQLRAYQDSEGKTASLIDLGNQALSRQIKNKNDARAANIALNNVANQLNPNIEEEATLLKQLNNQMDKNTQFIKDNASETAKQKMNIGNYSSALDGLDAVLSKFGVNGQQARTIVSGFSSTISTASNDITNFSNKVYESTKATLGFKTASQLANETQIEQVVTTEAQTVANTELTVATEAQTVATAASTLSIGAFTVALAATGIGLIVIALGSLIAYLTNTQSGIDKLNSVLEPLKAIFQTITSLASGLGSKLVSAFENPRKALSELGDFVKHNLINRFTAFAVILDGITNLDFKKIANGVIQVGTGVENVTGKLANIANSTAKIFSDSVAKGQQVASITKQINELQLKYNASQVAVNDALDQQLLISKDTSKTFKERGAAANAIIAITEKNGQAEKKILDLQLQRLKLQQSIKGVQNLTNEDKQAEIDLLAKIDDAEDRGLNARIEQSKVLSGLKKEQRDLAIKYSKEQIDLLIAQNGFAVKSTQEQLVYAQKLEQKKLDDLKFRQKNSIMSVTEYETEKLNIENEFLAKSAELTVQNANEELQIHLDKNAKILESDVFLSDFQYSEKQKALQEDLQAEIDYEKTRLDNKLISQAEYNKQVNKLNDDNDKAVKKLADDKKIADQNAALTDLENQKTINENNFIAQSAIDQAQNEIKRQQEVDNAEKTGADISLINAKYAQQSADIEETKQANKVQLASDAFGSLASIFGEESKAGKAAAIAQTTIDTYQSAVSAYKSLAGIPIVGPALGAIASGAAVV